MDVWMSISIVIVDELIGNFEPPSLDWSTRLNIIVEIARGLAYLHKDLQPPVWQIENLGIANNSR
jgi:hypothetical protein